MDKSIKELIKSIQAPHIYKDVMTIVGGIGFIIYLYIFYKEAVIDYIPSTLSLEIDFILLIVSYIIGKLLLWTGNILLKTFYSLFNVIYGLFTKSFKNFIYDEWHETIISTKDLFNLSPQYLRASPAGLHSTITLLEERKMMESVPSLIDDYERARTTEIFKGILLAITYINFIFGLNLFSLCLFFIALYINLDNDYHMRIRRRRVFESIVKSKEGKEGN
ncbi:MAG TPA: hypothetical protein DHS36_02760 [Candidatus Veblenbacteria bacterium]|uniref:Uncharacterized protein n=1 Tax=Candidatus Veblenbacteria bacterium RIFOXYC2_FULL_42_11 TaxID=1802428 RepID=A0A1G2Q6A8_9BACT|nr:MAG: hypothetical protein UV47_C0010G0013 [Parcubacteria group bacterium GW2011_GWA2_42_80]KKT14545.1 MAG: hypothetical protein UV96_C0027G0014 [Parcubacteria group bacterium GW2011_GWF2_43_38]OHA56073.1 MAG: hypothetical protein A2441_03700 [Candidatus Veblenbacteria bacterium RIFOXYC2_FULL_42_11]HCX39166.1 hypothetical protein [Candidatus Veblenbacteria bacterium]